jgi:hypothetical protein
VKNLLVLGLLLSCVTQAGTCPDLRGMWTCSLEINNYPEPSVTMSYRNIQKDLANGEVAYEIGGWEFTAKPDVETKVKGEIEGIVTTCKDSKLVITYKDELGIPCVQTVVRKSPTDMTSELLCDISDLEGNRSTAYFCTSN